MNPRYKIRCISRADDSEVVNHGGFPLVFATRRRAERRLKELVADAGPRSIYRYELSRNDRADRRQGVGSDPTPVEAGEVRREQKMHDRPDAVESASN